MREAVDADLLARACEWAATTPACTNETFNINNGDVFDWRHVWPGIADTLGMEVGPDRPMSLATDMPAREAEWRAYGAKQSPPTTLVSTIKARQAGFHDCMDTDDMFRKWFRRYQELRWLPPLSGGRR